MFMYFSGFDIFALLSSMNFCLVSGVATVWTLKASKPKISNGYCEQEGSRTEQSPVPVKHGL